MKKTLKFKHTIAILFLICIVIAIAVVLSYIPRATQIRSRAVASTTLSLTTASELGGSQTANVGDSIPVSLVIAPGQNLVSSISIEIDYDSSVLTVNQTPGITLASIFDPQNQIGPTYSQGKITMTLNVGPNSTNVIQQPMTIATIPFTVIGSGNSIIQINQTATSVYSISSSDLANENVLSSTIPISINVSGPTSTPSPTISPTVTVLPTTTPTPTLTNTPTPTSLPSNTPTPTTNPNTAILNFALLLDGLGSAGDNSNPNTSTDSNKSPQTPTRTLTVQIYNVNNFQVANQQTTIQYVSSSGTFNGSISVPNLNGDYTTYVTVTNYLTKRLDGIQHLVNGASFGPLTERLVTGDMFSTNQLNIQDLNKIITCFGLQVGQGDPCKVADLNDDGVVDFIDFNLFRREVIVQNGDISPTLIPTPSVSLTITPTPTTMVMPSPTGSPTASPTPVATNAVSINNFAFSPQVITVPVGTTVTWTNNQSGVTHTTTSDSGQADSWDSGHLTFGQSFSHTFATTGSFTYHCNIHNTMTGTVIVQ